jgi:hypothetical protein
MAKKAATLKADDRAIQEQTAIESVVAAEMDAAAAAAKPVAKHAAAEKETHEEDGNSV